MPATMAPPEQRVLLRNVSWDTYERLLAEREDSPGTRFTYDEGMLEIMVAYSGHEIPNRALASLVEIAAEETGTPFLATGSTTFKRADLKKGFEPDTSYYLTNEAQARGKKELDLDTDPPPDLVIEVDMTRSSLDRFPIFAAVGVPEVWRFDGERVIIYRLDGIRYTEIELSIELPPLTAAQLTAFLQERDRVTSVVWLRDVRKWVRSNLS